MRFTCQWLTRLRRELEIFNRLLESYEQLEGSEANEAIIAMVDVYGAYNMYSYDLITYAYLAQIPYSPC